MLSTEEEQFILYWEQNRLRKKRGWRQLSIGLPLGVALAAAILINIYSDWNPAGNMIRYDPQTMFVVLAAVLLIIIFVAIFAAKHRWDMNEQHYRELIAKKSKLTDKQG